MRNQSQLHFNYFEAVIQLRPYDIEVHTLIRKWVEDSGAFISRELKVRGGVDIYISSHRVAKKIGKRLKKTFNGTLKVSHTLYGLDNQTSKNLYRATVLFKKQA